MSLPALRPRSTRSLRRASTPATCGAALWNHRAMGAGIPSGTSARPPEVVAMSATPRTRSPNSSSWWAAYDITVMPPIECPTSTSGPVGRRGGDHRREVATELVDGGVLRRPATAATVAALVPEHEPAQRTQVAALVVPGVLLEGVAVAEDDGEPVAGAVGDRPLGRVLDLDVQRGAVVGDHRHDAAAQAAERLVALGVGAQRTADEHALGGDADRGADGGSGTERADDAGDAPRARRVERQRTLAHARHPQVLARHTRSDPRDDLVPDRAAHGAPSRRPRGPPRRRAPPRRPAAAASSPRSTTTWSMHTRPRSCARRPAASSGPSVRTRRAGCRRRTRAGTSAERGVVRRRVRRCAVRDAGPGSAPASPTRAGRAATSRVAGRARRRCRPRRPARGRTSRCRCARGRSAPRARRAPRPSWRRAAPRAAGRRRRRCSSASSNCVELRARRSGGPARRRRRGGSRRR